MAKLDRLLNLTATLLDTTVPLTAEEIRERVRGYPESDIAYHRAFERDKDELRALGYPVETVTVTHHEIPRSGYTIDKRRYALNDPGFTPEELAVLQLARTLVMFEGMEDGDDVIDTFRKLGGLHGGSAGPDPLGSVTISEELTTIFDAISSRSVLRFDYAATPRVVEPLNLTFTRGHWYLTAFDRGREEMRNFRTDRITGGVEVGDPGGFAARTPEVELITTPWTTGSGERVDVTVRIDIEPAAATLLEYPDLEVSRRLDDGAVEVTLPVRNRPGLFGFLAGLLDRAVVLGPSDVRDEYIEWLRSKLSAEPAPEVSS